MHLRCTKRTDPEHSQGATSLLSPSYSLSRQMRHSLLVGYGSRGRIIVWAVGCSDPGTVFWLRQCIEDWLLRVYTKAEEEGQIE